MHLASAGDAFTAGRAARVSSVDAAASFELYLRGLIAASATRVVMPAPPATAWASPKRMKRILAPSLARRLKFVDANDDVWRTVRAYFAPITSALADLPRSSTRLRVEFEALAWRTYMLLLAHKEQCEVSLDIGHLDASYLSSILGRVDSEAAARLAVVQGLFRSYDTVVQMPTFAVVRSSDAGFSERIDEILDDAHFLEVSHLRRLFGIEQNRRALIRDSRRLIAFIVKAKRWARGLLAAASAIAHVPANADGVLTTIAEMFELSGHNAPVITSRYDTVLPQYMIVVGMRSLQYDDWGGGLLSFESDGG